MLRDDGERFLPWMADPVICYEHLHRYRLAAELATGLKVLDLASGEGYGSALLARQAASVLGIDVDRDAVLHAQLKYGGPGVRFVQGSMEALPAKSEAFDLVVCFEALEHVLEQEPLCRETARVLSPRGLFVVSTPNRLVYSAAADFKNPFHVRELDRTELLDLLGRHFEHVRLYGQHVYPVSSAFPLDEAVGGAREFPVARHGDGQVFSWVDAGAKAPRYFIAVASRSPLPDSLRLESNLVDVSEQLFLVQRTAEGAVIELERHLKAREAQALALDRDLAQARQELAVAAGAAIELAEARAHLAARSAQAVELDALLHERGVQLRALADRLGTLENRVARMEATRTWRAHLRLQRLARGLRGLLPRSSGGRTQ